MVEGLVAVTIDGMACAGDQALLQHARLTPAQIARMRADLDKLPPMPMMVDKVNEAERFCFLDCVRLVAQRGGLDSLDDPTEIGKPESMFKSLIDWNVRTAVDWNQVLRMDNSWCDRLADAYGKPAGARRAAAMRKINNDISKLHAATRDWKSRGLSMLFRSRTTITEQVGQVFLSLFLPGTTACAGAEDRATMTFDLTKLAFALAAYHADRGAYPAKLADLTPKYVAEVPKDIFNDADLHYRPQGGGYLLYSVGQNGKDDGGKGIDDRKHGEDWDDIVVRMPAATAPKP